MRKFELDLFKLQLIYHRLLTRSLVVKLLLASIAIAALPFFALDSSDGCDDAIPSRNPLPPFDFDAVIKDLMNRNFISSGDLCLCIGPPQAAAAMLKLGVLAAVTENCDGRLGFREESFDFALWTGVDRAGAPARVLLEMERVLRAERFGAAVVGPVRAGGIVRAAAPVVSILRVSEVVSVRAVNGSVPGVLVVFKKKREKVVLWSDGNALITNRRMQRVRINDR